MELQRIEDLPSPWRRQLDRTAEAAFRTGVWQGFKAGIWFSVALWFITMGLWWGYSYITQ
jgi:hypothetical protein